MTRSRQLLCPLLGCLLAALLHAEAAAPGSCVPRRVLALYDSALPAETAGPEAHSEGVHRSFEMPLNRLGLTVDYVNLRGGLPPPRETEDVRGVLIWIDEDVSIAPEALLGWCEQMMDAGKRLVLVGGLPFGEALRSGRLTPGRANRLWSRLGLQWRDDSIGITYDVEVVHKDPAMVEFERPLPCELPGFERTTVADPRTVSYLALRKRGSADTASDLVVAGPGGGYVAEGYLGYVDHDGNLLQWCLNPFEFLRIAFAADDVPKPDVTTLCGRRIFYSHIDGDGWRSESQARSYRERHASCATVVYEQILKPYPDLPFTVAPIVADIDPDWYGTREGPTLAREMFSLPNVEAGSHTYTHPLNWPYFAGAAGLESTDRVAEAESRSARRAPGWLAGSERGKEGAGAAAEDDSASLYGAGGAAEPEPGNAPDAGDLAGSMDAEGPASYERGPFDLRREIAGSLAFVNGLCPPGKKAKLMQWSGDCLPFEAAVAAARAAGVRQINGGDSRFDGEFPSYVWVAPVGRQIGRQRQVYASNCNEMIYTALWTDGFFGFRYLIETVRRTESPLRVSPFNLYFHMYSGEKDASLAAMIDNLEDARSQELIPVTASHFAGIADGFFSTRFTPVGPRAWRVEQRDELQTVRFDRATCLAVDFEASRGVLGQRHFQGSLYVTLDPADPAAVIALRDEAASDADPPATRPYLVESRWPVWMLRTTAAGFEFRTAGFGPGEMTWVLPHDGPAWVRGARAPRMRAAQEVIPEAGRWTFSLGDGAGKPLDVSVTWEAARPPDARPGPEVGGHAGEPRAALACAGLPGGPRSPSAGRQGDATP